MQNTYKTKRTKPNTHKHKDTHTKHTLPAADKTNRTQYIKHTKQTQNEIHIKTKHTQNRTRTKQNTRTQNKNRKQRKNKMQNPHTKQNTHEAERRQSIKHTKQNKHRARNTHLNKAHPKTKYKGTEQKTHTGQNEKHGTHKTGLNRTNTHVTESTQSKTHLTQTKTQTK